MKSEKIKKHRALAAKNFGQMWGEDGPYSQVRLSEETRILDDSVSRIFLVVEAEINPFTFEFVHEHRAEFLHDAPVLQLLDRAQNRGKYGYVVSAGEVELHEEESRRFARAQADMATETVKRMHAFVMDRCGLRRPTKYHQLDADTFVASSAGIKDNKIRFYFVCARESGFDFDKELATQFAKTLKTISARFDAVVEKIDVYADYVCIIALLPFDVAPGNYIETVITSSNTLAAVPLFHKDYFVTNIKRPTPQEIISFLGQLQ